MSVPLKPAAIAPNSAPEDAPTATPVSPNFEQKLNEFWVKNRRLLFLLCAMVLIIIVAREVSTISTERARGRLVKAYAEAAATPEGLLRFAQANTAAPLGGVAWLQVADAAYTADNFLEAVNAYEQSLKGLERGSALADRAALGLAVAQLKSGSAEQGQEGLAVLADTDTVSVAVRAEAAYHLAIYAHVAGDQEVFAQRASQLAQIDPMSLWNQRLLSLQVTRALPGASLVLPLEAATKNGESDEAPSIQFHLGQ